MTRLLLCLILVLGSPGTAQAWNAKAHRLSVAVALDYWSAAETAALVGILENHPRFEQDFLRHMPAHVAGNSSMRGQWLLGQAAVWPDLARRFPATLAAHYHQAAWHYIDGRWIASTPPLPDAFPPIQGNVYVGMEALPDRPGPLQVADPAQVQNMMQALEYNRNVLRDPAIPAAERAIALCWVLHLVGDIHQPLHSGALFSPLFPNGDRGGNEIPTERGNLHARWDQALGPQSLNLLLPPLLAEAQSLTATIVNAASTTWLHESREILHLEVYRTDIRQAILQSDASRPTFLALDAAYEQRMYEIAIKRIALAGRRIAATIP